MILLNIFSCNEVQNYILSEDEYDYVMYSKKALIYQRIATLQHNLKPSIIETLTSTRMGRLQLLSEMFDSIMFFDSTKHRITKIINLKNVEIKEYAKEI